MVTVCEVLVNFIGDNPHFVAHCPLANCLHFCLGIHRTRGVIGRNKQQRLCLRCECSIELRDGDTEAICLVGVDDLWNTTGQCDGFRVSGPERSRANDFIARITQCAECNEHSVLATVGDQHLVGGALEATVAQCLHCNRFAQFGQTSRWRVLMVLRISSCLDGCFHNVGGSGEIGFTCTETNDILSLGLQSLGLGVNSQGG